MKRLSSCPIIMLLLALLPMQGISQTARGPVKKDSLVLSCLLYKSKEPAPEKAAVDYGGEPELKLVLTSATDSIVKACASGTVSTIQREQDGTYEVVFFHDDYWFWLSGLTRVTVTRNSNIKPGQAIGILATGKQLELLMFDFETPVDPRSYLRCKE